MCSVFQHKVPMLIWCWWCKYLLFCRLSLVSVRSVWCFPCLGCCFLSEFFKLLHDETVTAELYTLILHFFGRLGPIFRASWTQTWKGNLKFSKTISQSIFVVSSGYISRVFVIAPFSRFWVWACLFVPVVVIHYFSWVCGFSCVSVCYCFSFLP